MGLLNYLVYRPVSMTIVLIFVATWLSFLIVDDDYKHKKIIEYSAYGSLAVITAYVALYPYVDTVVYDMINSKKKLRNSVVEQVKSLETGVARSRDIIEVRDFLSTKSFIIFCTFVISVGTYTSLNANLSRNYKLFLNACIVVSSILLIHGHDKRKTPSEILDMIKR